MAHSSFDHDTIPGAQSDDDHVGTGTTRFEAATSGMNPGDFGDQYDIYPEFLPFAVHQRDPLAVLDAVREQVARLPVTAQYVTRSRVVRHVDDLDVTYGGTVSNIPTAFFLLQGAYPCPDVSEDKRRFANPRYHAPDELPSVTDDDARREWLARYARVGLVDYATIAPHFGLSTESSMHSLQQRLDYDWEGARQRGQRRMARTWALLHEWGRSWSDLARVFDTTRRAITRAVDAHASEFEPPADPTV